MTREEMYEKMEELFSECVTLSRNKNDDYASGEDPFSNFRLIEDLTNGRVTVEDGFLTRMSDKLQRAANLLGGKDPSVTDESTKDTLRDLLIYSAILIIWLESEG